MTLRVEQKRLRLEIADDGRGGDIVPGNGLAGMRERLATIDADVRIESRRGEGTTVLVTLPMPQSDESPAAVPAFRLA